MNPKCVEAVQAAIGRPITVAESRNIEQRVRDAMLSIAREDAARWQALPQSERLAEGAARAAEELVAEAQKKKQRLAATILAHDRIEAYTREQVARGADGNRMDAFARLIAGKTDGKNNGTSVESEAKGIMATTMGRLTGAWEAIRPGMLGFFANKEAEEQFVRALHGNTKNARPEIVKAAKAWADTAESLRQRFNAAGGIVGKLDNWGMPHAWSQDLAITAGRKAWLETLPLAERAIAIAKLKNPPPEFAKSAFVSKMQKLVDRRRYVHEDGRAYTDDEMGAFLGEAWVTIVTNGANKPVASNGPPGGRSVKANRNSQSRQIHFRDGDAYIEAMREFSGRNVFDVMVAHAKRMSADIALIEQFGPNADLTAQHFIDQIVAEDAKTNPTNEQKMGKRVYAVAHLYDFVAGNAVPPPNRRLANAAAAVRAWLTASKLGSAAVTSISDEGTLYLTSKVNNLPLVQVFLNEVRALNPADRAEKRLAQRAGLLVHTMSDEMDRWGTETLGQQIPDKIASAVMRASGLSAITEARRRAFSITMMDAIGEVTRHIDDVSKLDPGDWQLLRDKGITGEEWAIWRAATPETWRGNDTVLTPEAIYAIPDDVIAKAAPGVAPSVARERAASKLLAVVLEEQDIAIIEPGARERSMISRGGEKGTVYGELRRSFFQFKTFPIAMMMRHWQRAMGMYSTTRGRAGYIATLVAAQTVMGAVAMEVNDIISGKDPRNLDPTEANGARNWLAALLKGGSLGLYGDFLFAETTQYGQSLLGAAAGPAAGFIEDVDDLTRGNIMQAMRGEDADVGAEAVKFARGYTPGSSLWYAKASLDRLVFHQMQEYFSPGYLSRMKNRARETQGTTYWWNPGDMPGEARAPDLERVAGAEE